MDVKRVLITGGAGLLLALVDALLGKGYSFVCWITCRPQDQQFGDRIRI